MTASCGDRSDGLASQVGLSGQILSHAASLWMVPEKSGGFDVVLGEGNRSHDQDQPLLVSCIPLAVPDSKTHRTLLHHLLVFRVRSREQDRDWHVASSRKGPAGASALPPSLPARC